VRSERSRHLGLRLQPSVAPAGRTLLVLSIAACLSPLASFLLPLTSYFSPLAAQSAPPAKVAKSVERVFGPGVEVDTLKVDTASVLRVSKSGALLGFAQVRNVKGKDQPITFLVAIDSDNVIKDVDVLVYREPQGGEVAYEPWRKQFRGKTTAAQLVVGKDIKNISGATISSHSVTLAVRKALADLTAWHAAGKIK
jgi:Na+-translocating ferredoxin:NAD+ oxidoreductase RnfG subunit